MLSIVVPMHNEAESAPKLVAAVAAVVDRPFELILVDDGSTDATNAVIQGLADEDSRVVPLTLSRNFGKEGALSAGLEAARGDAVVLMDGDLQHPPQVIPELLAKWDEGFDVVNAVKADRGDEGVLYRACAAMFYRLMGASVRERMDGQSDFKLLDRQVVDAVLACDERNRFFRGLVAWLGFKVAEVPFTVQARAAGSTSFGVLALFRYSVKSLIAFSSAPLLSIAWVGFLTMGAAAVLSLQTFYNWWNGTALDGFTTVILAVLIMGGVILLCQGVISLYLAVIYDELKGRPLFVLRKDARSQTSQQKSAVVEMAKPRERPAGQ
ncbi:MAG: glycosyltransferase family 2 protein [Proteobacteria bacterium]|nr:glycosyltransferase family 2 protein [Pseudomonadota bacterium]MCP4917185.1 glycosyltransferase family 2 protein [Pseudomonadota bacterium]